MKNLLLSLVVSITVCAVFTTIATPLNDRESATPRPALTQEPAPISNRCPQGGDCLVCHRATGNIIPVALLQDDSIVTDEGELVLPRRLITIENMTIEEYYDVLPPMEMQELPLPLEPTNGIMHALHTH